MGKLISDVIDWVTVDRASVLIAAFALAGIVYSAISTRAARTQARSSKEAASAAKEQAALAREQVQVPQRQTDLLLKQVEQAERAEALTRDAQREALQPMVVVSIDPAPTAPEVLIFTVENIGPSIARNIKIRADPPPTRSSDSADRRPMHEWHVFTHGIKTLVSHQKLVFFFDSSRRFGSGLPMAFTFTVNADGPFGPAPELVFEIDLDAMGSAWIGYKTLGSVVREMEKIRGGLGEVTNAIRQLDPEVAEQRREMLLYVPA